MKTQPTDGDNQPHESNANEELDTGYAHPIHEQVDYSPEESDFGGIPLIPPGFKAWDTAPPPKSKLSLRERLQIAREALADGKGPIGDLIPDFPGPSHTIWTKEGPIYVCPIDEGGGAVMSEFPTPGQTADGKDAWVWHPDVYSVEKEADYPAGPGNIGKSDATLSESETTQASIEDWVKERLAVVRRALHDAFEEGEPPPRDVDEPECLFPPNEDRREPFEDWTPEDFAILQEESIREAQEEGRAE